MLQTQSHLLRMVRAVMTPFLVMMMMMMMIPTTAMAAETTVDASNTPNNNNIIDNDIVRYFVIAGQSNVGGEADLIELEQIIRQNVKEGDNGIGIENDIFQDYSQYFNPETSKWTSRPDVFVTYDRVYDDFDAKLEGNLVAGRFGDDALSFGPEVEFGFQMGDYYQEEVVIVKGVGIGSLAEDWDAENGRFYNLLLADIEDAMNRIDDITSTTGKTAVLTGIVWWQGYGDVFVEAFRSNYGVNLQSFVDQLRLDLKEPDLPIVIVGLGGQGSYAGMAELELREYQQMVADSTDHTTYTDTAQFNPFSSFEEGRTDGTCPDDFHYYCSARTVTNIARQISKDMITLINENEATSAPTEADCPYPDPGMTDCPQDVILLSDQTTQLDVASPINIITQDEDSVTFTISNPFESTVQTMFYQFLESPSGSAECLKEVQLPTCAPVIVTAKCGAGRNSDHSLSNRRALVTVWFADPNFVDSLDDAEIPKCCYPNNEDVVNANSVAFTYKIFCETQCPTNTARRVE